MSKSSKIYFKNTQLIIKKIDYGLGRRKIIVNDFYGSSIFKNENKIIRIWHPFIKGFFQKDLLNNKNIFDKTLAKEIEIL